MSQIHYVAAVQKDAELVRTYMQEWCVHAIKKKAMCAFSSDEVDVAYIDDFPPFTHDHGAAVRRLAETLYRGKKLRLAQTLMEVGRSKRPGDVSVNPVTEKLDRWSPRTDVEDALREAQHLSSDCSNVIGTYPADDLPVDGDRSLGATVDRLSFVRERLDIYRDGVGSRSVADPKSYNIADDLQVDKACRGLATFALSRSMESEAKRLLQISRGECLEIESDENCSPYAVLEDWAQSALDELELAALTPKGELGETIEASLESDLARSGFTDASTEDGEEDSDYRKTVSSVAERLNETDLNILQAIEELVASGTSSISKAAIAKCSGAAETVARDTLASMVRFGLLNHNGNRVGYSLSKFGERVSKAVATHAATPVVSD